MDRMADYHWYVRKFMLSDGRDVDAILPEITACHEKIPGRCVRVVGYDNRRRTPGARSVIRHGDGRTN
jgi:ribulose bisphosphate carboxylase small subunit